MADTWTTCMSLQYENESRPYKRRTVVVELTPEQEEMIRPRVVGQRGNGAVYEELLECRIEHDPPDYKEG